EGAPEKRGMVLIHGLPPDRRGAGSSGPPAPIVEGRAPFVKNRSFVLPSFFKPVTDWPRPAACTGGQNAVYSDHEKRPGFPAPAGGTLPGALWRGAGGKAAPGPWRVPWCAHKKGGAFVLETVRVYAKRTDKVYLLLCLFSSAMAVLMLASWAAEQGGGFAVDEITGQITGIGDYRRALVQAGASGAGVLIALLLSTVDYRSLVKVWPF